MSADQRDSRYGLHRGESSASQPTKDDGRACCILPQSGEFNPDASFLALSRVQRCGTKHTGAPCLGGVWPCPQGKRRLSLAGRCSLQLADSPRRLTPPEPPHFDAMAVEAAGQCLNLGVCSDKMSSAEIPFQNSRLAHGACGKAVSGLVERRRVPPISVGVSEKPINVRFWGLERPL